ncbi:conserved hypothetical protein [Rubrobacter xylanophilus DSM 9941]|uniref:TauD/TfdA-like domain-containing protein n=1 Tax=Rubrobacter xylanophilus (strain DSM 9941 / JCM 11954 / NBRC 16129 / PRD-1) TaxID=266117 RepID=Q1AWV7_RUBXD|nr:guanitoxin biosynthesis L-enduracididine beta-hydroxylase GntD [Rubrobacter xylanophilus]ABG04121.1 conserved hypothetical protein [Rubrobacter xylanophilus DSM 9941]
MHRIELTAEEVEQALPVVREALSRHGSVESPGFLEEATVYAHELPRRLRSFLNAFRLEEPSGVCVVAGYPVDDARIGPTPSDWRKPAEKSPPAAEEEVFLALCGSLLGDLFSWAHQRDGLICQDLVPIERDAGAMLGSGSALELVWHTEDARYSYRGDYIGLMCLRNPDAVPTTYASIDDIELDPERAAPLFEPRFVFRPDPSHPTDTGCERASILFGDPSSPYLRFDPYSMDRPEDEEARAAMDYLAGELDRRLTGVALRPGECLFIDNYKVVHGRSAFKARFDGTDRWLKRVNITRDLRRSRSARRGVAGRLVF